MTSVETLGQSLNHWQAIYIISITIALLSTIAVVTFAFHIQEHKSGLKMSNYVYVLASLLAVISTVVIVVKSKSVDAEKDRLLQLAAQANELRVSQADQKAADSLEKAVAAQLELDTLRPTVSTLQTAQGTTSKVVAKLATPRTIRSDAAEARSLDKLPGAHILVQADYSDADSMMVYRRLAEYFHDYAPQPAFSAVLGMPLLPSFYVQAGIHIRHEDSPTANRVASSVAALLRANKIECDNAVPTGEDLTNLQLGKNWPDGTDKVLIVICKRN